MANYCMYCGKSVQEDAGFCMYCGRPENLEWSYTDYMRSSDRSIDGAN